MLVLDQGVLIPVIFPQGTSPVSKAVTIGGGGVFRSPSGSRPGMLVNIL